MLKIGILGGIQPTLRKLERIKSQAVPRALVEALNKTALDVRDELKVEMLRAFDRPTSFTLNSLFIDQAKPGRLWSAVKLKDFASKGTPASVYLAPQVYGGARVHKRFEQALIRARVMPGDKYAIPVRLSLLDRHGNYPGRIYTQVLSALKASPDPMQSQTRRTKARTKRQQGYRYFVPNRSGVPLGIARAKGGSGVAEFLFVFGRAPHYTQRFDFFGIGQRVATARFKFQFDKAAARELAAVQAKG